MSEPKFTPGPWEVTGPDVWFRWGNVDLPIAKVAEAPRGRESAEEGAANARLISAAPDLYAALQYMLDNHEAPAYRVAAHAAIAKAEGR